MWYVVTKTGLGCDAYSGNCLICDRITTDATVADDMGWQHHKLVPLDDDEATVILLSSGRTLDAWLLGLSQPKRHNEAYRLSRSWVVSNRFAPRDRAPHSRQR